MRSVTIANRHPRLRFDRRSVVAAIHALDAAATRIRVPHAGFLPGELSLVFLTDAALGKLHGTFLDDPTWTDVITFEGDAAFGTGGEICVSADAALRHVGPRRAAAFAGELTLYLVHGWLHLAGYDDLVPAKKRLMRRAEARAMAVLRQAGVVPNFRLVA